LPGGMNVHECFLQKFRYIIFIFIIWKTGGKSRRKTPGSEPGAWFC